jgi:Flp pilus assembly protein TadD
VSASDPDSPPVSPDGEEFLPPRWQAAWRWGVPILTLAVLALIAWKCLFNPEIRFLTPGPGQWIVYPLPAEGHTYTGFDLVGTFRRTFALPEQPAAALVSWRCSTAGELIINGIVVRPSAPVSKNWKKTLHADVGPFLHQGSNEISVTVLNEIGPPALSLALRCGNFSLDSDETWEVSVSGSNWRAAQAASATPRAGKGNPLQLLETTSGALRSCWRWLCLCAVIAIGGVAMLRYYFGRVSVGTAKGCPKMVLILMAALWVLLFLHNFPSMPPAAGFDGPAHLDYVRYIQEYQILPSAWEGAEMFQPPLYYLISAALLGLAHCQVYQPSGLMVLRFLSLAIGAVNLALVFIGLRLIFPDDWRKPLAGLALAAFLPAQVYLLHFTTNETLSAMLVTGALCLAVHLFQERRPWPGWHYILGIVLGLALCSKVSALLAVSAILGGLMLKLIMRREGGWRVWLRVVGVPLLMCLLVSGWHYLRLWHEYGNPFTGNWNPIVIGPWWQIKGFQTSAYYFSFGDSLTRPFYSGFHSFWDALYTTLWGDGLLGGSGDTWARPPWNYDLMAAGFILALAPTVLVVTGLVRVLVQCSRAAKLTWCLLLGLAGMFAFAIFAMSFEVPSYAQTKAFYGLPVLLPFCAMGALGFEFWTGRGKKVRFAMAVVLGIWLVNLYASFWIRPNTFQTEMASALCSHVYMKQDTAASFSNILTHYPGNLKATVWLAASESRNDPVQSVKRLEQALKENPDDTELETELARELELCGRLDEAVGHAKRAMELGPENEDAGKLWCSLALRDKKFDEAVKAGRMALSLNPSDLTTHFNLGVALMNLRQIPEATSHFSALVNAQPGWAESQYCLGRCLLGQPGRRAQAVSHLGEAVRLSPTNADWQVELQKARESR